MTQPFNPENGAFLEEVWFKDFGEGPVLAGSRCRSCNKVFFPKKPVCPQCYVGELEDVPLSRRGRIHAYALSHMGPADIPKPYVMAFVDLPEGIKLYSIIKDCDP
ncbi:MAG: zinc ribbon domain-containing protein [Thermodesulfobacteriota bacterium]